MLKLESAYAVRKSGKLGSEAGGERTHRKKRDEGFQHRIYEEDLIILGNAISSGGE